MLSKQRPDSPRKSGIRDNQAPSTLRDLEQCLNKPGSETLQTGQKFVKRPHCHSPRQV